MYWWYQRSYGVCHDLVYACDGRHLPIHVSLCLARFISWCPTDKGECGEVRSFGETESHGIDSQ